ncbi:hypothetical protein LEP1GSC040_3779 [Leptospira santarosai str. 2000030832]|nr:hypothetical protein LEP1GSC040_3779 [Leptospira santarosai str. 2000030832]
MNRSVDFWSVFDSLETFLGFLDLERRSRLCYTGNEKKKNRQFESLF